MEMCSQDHGEIHYSYFKQVIKGDRMTLEEIREERDKLQDDITAMLCEFSNKIKDVGHLSVYASPHEVPTEVKKGMMPPLVPYVIVR